ncbi:MAG: hypothetical protein IT462_11960 [Planctomycetes bacterium]|nr:hypothetical protein [Planctomycetota bacterium]
MIRPVSLIVIFAALILGGCAVGNQARSATAGGIDRSEAELSIYRHGRNGLEVERYYAGAEMQNRIDPLRGQTRGYIETEFYTVHIAKDPTKRDVMTLVGYMRRIEEERRGEFLFEFYDDAWDRIAWMNPRGELYTYGIRAGEVVHEGNYQIETAAAVVYKPRSGYGYDAVTPDLKRTQGLDPDVVGTNPAARGVVIRQHRGHEPKIEVRQVPSSEAAKLRTALEANIFNSSNEIALEELRKATRGEKVDGPMGGIEFKDRQPVDANGRPIQRGDKAIEPGK